MSNLTFCIMFRRLGLCLFNVILFWTLATGKTATAGVTLHRSQIFEATPWPTCDNSDDEPFCEVETSAWIFDENEDADDMENTTPAQDDIENKLDDVFRLLELGEAEIELSEKEIVLVVGMSGSGKSTLVQFVAGEECRLYANRSSQGMFIWDKYGAVSNQTIISKTLLPELTIDNQTNVAYYDCPGFSDLRNVSVEIANAFFIKKIVDYASRVKVIMVVLHSHLNTLDRGNFVGLIKQLIFLIQDPQKLRNGIGMVTAAGDINEGWREWDALNQYSCFLQHVRRDLPQIWPDEVLLERAQLIIDTLLSNVENHLTKVGIFKKPVRTGCLDEMEDLQCAKRNIKHLISSNLQYIEKEIHDFGYALSADAHNLINAIMLRIDRKIKNAAIIAGATIQDILQHQLNKYVNDDDYTEGLVERLSLLKSATYPSPVEDHSEIIKNITDTLESFSIHELDDVLTDLAQQSEYLRFFKQASDGVAEMYPDEWIEPLIRLKIEVFRSLPDLERSVDRKIINFMPEIASKVRTTLDDELNTYINGSQTVDGLLDRLTSLKHATYPKSNSSSGEEPYVYLEEIIETVSTFVQDPLLEHFAYLRLQSAYLIFLRDLTDENEIEISPKQWILPLLTTKDEVFRPFSDYVRRISSSVIESTAEIAADVEKAFKVDLTEFVNGVNNSDVSLSERLLALKEATYPITNSTSEDDPSCYSEEIVDTVNKFYQDSSPGQYTTLRLHTTHLSFFRNLSDGSIGINPRQWLEPLLAMRDSVFVTVREKTDVVVGRVYIAFENAFITTGQEVLKNMSNVKDQFERAQIASEFRIIADAVDTDMKLSFSNADVLITFMEATIINLKKSLSQFLPLESVTLIESEYSYLFFFATIIDIPWKEPPRDWAAPSKTLKDIAQNEHVWANGFIIRLYQELSGENVQIHSGRRLHVWWEEFAAVTLDSFKEFWEKLAQEEVSTVVTGDQDLIKEALVSDPRKLTSLNNLLNKVLLPQVPCSQPLDGVVSFNSTFLDLNRVMQCVGGITKPTRVVLLAFHTVFINTGIVGSSVNIDDNLDIFIMAPKYRITGNIREIDLRGGTPQPHPPQTGRTGAVGAPGRPGHKAGNAIIIGQDFHNGQFNYNIDGGGGGAGQSGEPGLPGPKGSRQEFSLQSGTDNQIEDKHCSAWSGWVKVKLHPHECSTNMDSDGRCEAPNSGSHYKVFGLPGTNGNPGGNGGKGGHGGKAGNIREIRVPEAASILTGRDGSDGTDGSGGSGGPGGQQGDTNECTIDDRTSGNKECMIINGPKYYEVNAPADPGTRGTDGANSVGRVEAKPQKFIRSEYQQYINRFSQLSTDVQTDEFFVSFLPKFIQLVKDHSEIP